MSTLPPWMPEPDAPQPEPGGDWFSHVIDQRPDGAGYQLVTFALPGLATATVRVPQTAWLNGDHLALGPALTRLITPPAPVLDGPEETPPEYQPADDQPDAP